MKTFLGIVSTASTIFFAAPLPAFADDFPCATKPQDGQKRVTTVEIRQRRANAGSLFKSVGINIIEGWIQKLKTESSSPEAYYFGKARDEKFGELDARRINIILPSEYYRDSKSEWDNFEIVISNFDNCVEKYWISTENYKRRSRGGFGSAGPSPDLEHTAVTDNDVVNSRLRQLAEAIKRIAVSEQRALDIAPDKPAQSTPP